MVEKQIYPLPAKRRAWTETAFRARVLELANTIGVYPSEIHLRAMRRKWASCSSRGRLTFDTSLLARERGFGEFVIVHELLHLRVPNHGKLFKSLLSAYVPGWEQWSNPRQTDPKTRSAR